MGAIALKVPEELEALINAGRWPRDREHERQQNLHPLVPAAWVRAFAQEESFIYLLHPPFYSVRQLVDGGEHDFWTSPNAAPNEISFDHSLVIADFGLGSDSPVVLDYRAVHDGPKVLRLKWGHGPWGAHGDNHWVEVAPNFH